MKKLTQGKYFSKNNECSVYFIIFEGDHVAELIDEQMDNNGSLPSCDLYDGSRYYVQPGAFYEGDIDITLTKRGNTKVSQYCSFNV